VIRPWYRSRLFWLGLPGLLFLLWGWLADPLAVSGVTVTLGDYRLTVGDWSRVGRISWEVYGSGGRLSAQGIRTFSGRLGGSVPVDEGEVRDRQAFPPAFRYEVQEDHSTPVGLRRIPQVRVAYWLLLLLYLPAWGALLAGWQRRKSRLLNLHAAPPP
jgi:hypothetical protein